MSTEPPAEGQPGITSVPLGETVRFALAVGLVGGLIEGVGHIALQWLGVPENSWYRIIWFAPVFNSVLLVILGVIVSKGIPVIAKDPRSARRVVLFALLLTGCLPWIALLLKEWVRSYASALLAVGVASVLTRVIDRHYEACRRGLRRAVLAATLATLLALVTIEGGAWLTERLGTARLPSAPASAPNVLVVVIDALRADHLSTYGYPRETSPAIDRLAAQGVVFEQALSTSSYTLPSHASMLTGLYPSEHGIDWGTAHRVGAWKFVTLPEALQTHGYRTAAFSANTFYFSREHGFGRGFLHFDDFYHSLSDTLWRTAYGGIVTRLIRPRLGFDDLPARKRASDINLATGRWVAERPDLPFFVIVNYMDAHDPYLPPQPYRSRFSTTANPGGVLNFKLRNPPLALRPEQLQGEIDAYDGGIAYVDDHLDQLVSELRARTPGRDLLVFITSDHGEEFGEHGGYVHARHLYREAIHVPLIVWGPGRVPSGTRVKQAVSIAWIPATVTALLQVSQDVFPGTSLSLLWGTSDHQVDGPMPLAELQHRPWAFMGDPVRTGSLWSLSTSAWHYIEHEGQGPQLFDWINDPKESTNLADRNELQQVLRSFSTTLAARRR